MNLTIADLDNLSTLARINIAPDEKEKMLADMQAILGYVSEINDVTGDVTNVGYTTYNVVREDVVTNSSGEKTDAILANAPAVKDGYVEVMQVLK
jgi:aspartyl-tRNA(Asn)/glutamyl-tRNA(Gln) amidotransferase subunit C